MKHQYILLIYLAAAIPAIGQIEYLNTKTPYYPQQKNYTPAPKGFLPVFINYVGRHGARFQTSADQDLLIDDVLKHAANQNGLTEIGKEVLIQIVELEKIEKDNYGNITLLGKEEQQQIAQRMEVDNKDVFNDGNMLVEMTEKSRTQQSAKAFISGFKNYDTAKIQFIIFPAASDSILRFYDLSKAYKDYETNGFIKNHIDSLLNNTHTTTAALDVCKTIFTSAFIDDINNKKILFNGKQDVTIVNFSLSLYEVYASMFSASIELQPHYHDVINTFKKIFSLQALQQFDEVNSASDFYEKGPAQDANGIQVTIASPLLNDLISTTDTAIQFKKYDAVLRFTHAEAISPLATLMQIPQASKTSNSVFHFYENWKPEHIIPMSANIQWILYSDGKNYLIKVLLNEKEAAVPIATTTFPYYNWNDVKNYYINRLAVINKN